MYGDDESVKIKCFNRDIKMTKDKQKKLKTN